jgi:hypothetical protein
VCFSIAFFSCVCVYSILMLSTIMIDAVFAPWARSCWGALVRLWMMLRIPGTKSRGG